MANIAVVEDDIDYLTQIEATLRMHGHTVSSYSTRQSARTALRAASFDALLLDLKIDGDEMAGFKLLQELPASDRPRVLVISSIPEVHIWRPLMLNGGAWDYLEKTVELPTLIIKLTRLIQIPTKISTQEETIVRCGSLAWPQDRICEMSWKGTKLGMNLAPARIVTKLVRKNGETVPRRLLLAELDTSTDDNLFTTISDARSAFKAFDPDFKALRTVNGIGYRWLE